MTTNKKKSDARMVGTIIVNTPSSVTFTEVNATLFNSDGNNASGGFLQGGLKAWKRGKKDDAAIFIGFPAAQAGSDMKTFQYPGDFDGPSIRWVFIDKEGKHHSVNTGTITIEFGRFFSFFKGVYSFADTEGQVVRGSFDVRYVE
ncbi:hypothetical protein E3Z27_04765 [Pseudomonas mediterranea]|uniref:DUF3224 domain-containing protein n=1 Tax=Pseudomonas mediterranea TaxID=183795 RepID=A0AAX2DJ42_9PSED|nr:hypothetical protein [Pseudomonas mediterranea]KGU85001.1 hypothetical protein N005_16790 [Pseudomonas mediterranea CFBP 5447]QHA81040.1 hypothetical protein E3Z27_04765 [Pseudomonas mediterranea]SDU75535.1 hypothetical protein SAMN05216476_5457 [Pseudomonas mediterranea]